MKYNKDDHEFNEDCVKKPLRWLRREFNPHLVYLRKRHRGKRRQDDMNGLMSRLKAERRIISRKDEESRQARELWQFIEKVTGGPPADDS